MFPALLDNDVPFHVHEIDAYWNDVGSLPEYLRGNLDAVEGAVEVEPAGELLEPVGRGRGPGARRSGRGRPGAGRGGCEIGAGVRLDGPLVIGAGCAIGAGRAGQGVGASCPGREVPPGALVASADLRPQGRLT